MLHVPPECFVDILWGPQGGLRVAGPDRRYRTVNLRAGTIVAVRFRRGAAGPLLGVSASELADSRVALSHLWGRAADDLAEELEAVQDPEAALALLRGALLTRMQGAPPPDDLVQEAIARLRRSRATTVSELSGSLGVSERQLRRRFTAAVGHGPKRAQRIFRVQRFDRLALRCRGSRGIEELAARAGFVDQAHLTNECLALLGLTPGRLIRRYAPHDSGAGKSGVRFLQDESPLPDIAFRAVPDGEWI